MHIYPPKYYDCRDPEYPYGNKSYEEVYDKYEEVLIEKYEVDKENC